MSNTDTTTLTSEEIENLNNNFAIEKINETNNLTTKVVAIESGLEHELSCKFESGNVVVSNNELVFSDNNKRGRTPERNPVILSANDLVEYDEKTIKIAYKARYSDGTLTDSGWLSGSVIIPKTGEYWFVVAYLDDSVIDPTNITVMVHSKNINNIVEGIDSKLASLETAVNATNKEIILDEFKFLAHRGYSAVAPQNTIPAFAAAKKAGFEWIETDVRFTSDGYAVLIHDATVNATSDGTGTVVSKTLAELKALDFGSWFNPAFAGTKIPTLEEGLTACKRLGLFVYLELKASNMTATQYQTIVNTVKALGMWESIVFESFMLADLRAMANIDNTANLAFLTNARDLDVSYDANDATINEAITFLNTTQGKHNVILWQAGRFTDEQAKAVHDSGLYLETYTVDYANIDTMLIQSSGVLDGCITNDITPSKFAEYYLPTQS